MNLERKTELANVLHSDKNGALYVPSDKEVSERVLNGKFYEINLENERKVEIFVWKEKAVFLQSEKGEVLNRRTVSGEQFNDVQKQIESLSLKTV